MYNSEIFVTLLFPAWPKTARKLENNIVNVSQIVINMEDFVFLNSFLSLGFIIISIIIII